MSHLPPDWGTSTSAAGDSPPAGRVWFVPAEARGPLVSGQMIYSSRVVQAIVLVGHLSQTVGTMGANLRISLDGKRYAGQVVSLADQGDLFRMTYTPPLAGIYRFELADSAGTILASGSLTVT